MVNLLAMFLVNLINWIKFIDRQVRGENLNIDLLYESPVPKEVILKPWVFHVASLMILLPLGVMFMLPILILWYVHVKNFLTNATTSERFGRKGKRKAGQVESELTADMEDGMSTTTSLLAERLVEQIGKRPEVTGSCPTFKNCWKFCGESMSSKEVGYQERIVQDLLENQRQRHGFEEDWGLVVTQMNQEISIEEYQDNQFENRPFLPKKIRARTLAERHGGDFNFNNKNYQATK